MIAIDKLEQLNSIREELLNLKNSPLYRYRVDHNYLPVVGEGSDQALVVMIGEAPGKNEAETGKPFCGAAGKVLDRLLTSIQLDRDDIYITNIVKDRPPDNRDPTSDEIALYAPFLDRQIRIIRPQVIVTLGRYSMWYMLDRLHLAQKDQPISALHGKPIPVKVRYGQITLLPLYHPAVALYNSHMYESLAHDFAVLKRLIIPNHHPQ